MAGPPPNLSKVSNLLSTHRALLDTLMSFLTVTTHHILYLRRLYPPISFLSTRAYNYPVRQNRHLAVCTWVNDAVAAVRDQLEKSTVEKVSICIFECDNNRFLERWTFDLRSFPSIAKRDGDVALEPIPAEADDSFNTKINLADLEAEFRATLSRISTAAARLKPLPEGPGAPECSFAMSIEVKDKADRPVGRIEKEERKWIAAEPDTFLAKPPSSPSRRSDQEAADATFETHPVRRLEAGELRMEVWVEESARVKSQFTIPQSMPGSSLPPQQRAAKMTYGAGKEKFDADNMYGYDLEPPDVNRKPQGGAMTDYQRG